MAHALRLSDAFQILDNGPKMGKKFDNRYGEQSRGKFSKLSERQPPRIDKSKTNMDKHHGSSRSEPPCPFWTCKAKGAKHLIKKCPEATGEEKRSMLATEKPSDGPTVNKKPDLCEADCWPRQDHGDCRSH